MSERIKRFFILDKVKVTVTQSQVFNWVKLLNEEGIETDCISLTPKKVPDDQVPQLEESFGGRFYQVSVRTIIFNELNLALFLLRLYLKHRDKYDKIIFQTRLPNIGLTFSILKDLPKTKFVFESRAAWLAENEHVLHKENLGLKMRIKQNVWSWSEKKMIQKSDLVICVSKALQKYYIDKYSLSDDKFFMVFPGAADSTLFDFNPELRKKFRNKLDYQDSEIVIIYSGRLEFKWEIPDKIIAFFENLFDRNPNFRLLLLTPDTDIALEHARNFSPRNVIKVRKSKLEEVNGFLNASDISILLREDVIMNNVASPTKFAEYLMAGLNVIISRSVSDFSKMIDETGFGTVVNGLKNITDNEYAQLERSLKIERDIISEWGKNHLSKETFLPLYTNTLKNI